MRSSLQWPTKPDCCQITSNAPQLYINAAMLQEQQPMEKVHRSERVHAIFEDILFFERTEKAAQGGWLDFAIKTALVPAKLARSTSCPVQLPDIKLSCQHPNMACKSRTF